MTSTKKPADREHTKDSPGECDPFRPLPDAGVPNPARDVPFMQAPEDWPPPPRDTESDRES